MQNPERKWLIGAGAVVCILIVVALVTRPSISGPSNTATSTASSTQNGVTGSGDFEVSQDDVPTLNVPDFQSPLTFAPNIATDVRTALQKNADVLVATLSQNPLDLESWVNLGLLRKMAGDYKGAETAWKFVTEAAPKNSIAYNNLGDIYATYLKDYPKAEASYLEVIKLTPKDINPYRELSVLYANFYKKGTTAPEDTLKKGLVAVPESVDLHATLARYYRTVGRETEAKVQYEAAIAAATKTGQADIAAELRVEENQR